MRTYVRHVSALLGAALLLPACNSIGVDNVVFATRTNVAVDFDASPPTASIGYKRDELVLEPRDEFGRTLPVLTTVSTRPGIFEWGANHSFATGDAALMMAEYLTSNVDLSSVDEPWISAGKLKADAVAGRPQAGNAIFRTGRERIVFTTNTSFGMEVAWNAESVPDAVSLGWKRKEFAYVPLAKVPPELDENGNVVADPDEVYLVSLLATAHGGSKIDGKSSTGAVIGQTFATGLAATLMATHPEVRRALGPAIVPKYDDIMEARRKIRNEDLGRVHEVQLLQTVYDGLDNIDGEAPRKLRERLNATSFGADVPFRMYESISAAPYLASNDTRPAPPVGDESVEHEFVELLQYLIDLDAAVVALEEAVKHDDAAFPVSESGDGPEAEPLPGEKAGETPQARLERYRELRRSVEERLRGNDDVKEAVKMFVRSLTGGN